MSNTSITILQNGLFHWRAENAISTKELTTGIKNDIREPDRLLSVKQFISDYEMVNDSIDKARLPLEQNEITINSLKLNTETIKKELMKIESPAYSETDKKISQSLVEKLNKDNEEIYNQLETVRPLYDRGAYKTIGEADFEYKDITTSEEADEMFDKYNYYHATLGSDMKFLEIKKEANNAKLTTLEKERSRIEDADMITVMNDLMMQQRQFEVIARTLQVVHEMRLTNWLK